MATQEWQTRPPYTMQPEFIAKYTASCYCGAVVYEISEDPVDSTYCHCRGCQTLHGAPLQWASIFRKEAIRFTKGVDKLLFYNSGTMQATHDLPCKVSCSSCRTPIADEGRRMWLAFPTLIHNFSSLKESFRPSCHIFYGQRCIDVKDGLPKFEGHKSKSEELKD